MERVPEIVRDDRQRLLAGDDPAAQRRLLLALGQLGAQNLGKAAAMIPVAALSVGAGVWLVRRIPQRAFYLFITWALLAVSLKLIADAVM